MIREASIRFIHACRKDTVFRATPSAVAMFTRGVIDQCLRELQQRARESGGLSYIQVFDSDEHDDNLLFVEDNGEGAVTALPGNEY